MVLIGKACLLALFCLVKVEFGKTENNATEENNVQRPVVRIRDGLIRGKVAKTVSKQKNYYAFQGIPYAEPPIGPLRFKAPEKKGKWTNQLDVTEDKSECLQYGSPSQGSEDCLYLNVYTTNLDQINKLPVMVWIYGGGFAFGNSSYKSYGPDYLLDEDVVFVSFNYRVSIFGYGSTEDEACPGNFGLKDQILALKWVRDNVGFFGGDPKKVTIFGQSAGSASVSYILQTNEAKNLFRAAIMESGTSTCLWALTRKSKETMIAIGQALKVNTSTSTSLIEGLRKVDSKTLQDVAFAISINATIENLPSGLIFGPVKEPGFVDKYSDQALYQGKFLRKPVLMGFTSNEAISVVQFIAVMKEYFEKYYNKSKLVPVDLTKNQTKISEASAEIRSYYFGTSPIINQTAAIIQFLSDDLFNRAIRRTVINQSKYVPVYFYMFSYKGLLGGGPNSTLTGVGHAEDVSYLFRRDFGVTLPQYDLLTRSRMVKFWTNFAKFLNPTPKRDPLFEDIIWLPSNVLPNNEVYLNINADLDLQLNPFNKNMKFWDKIYEQFGEPPYDTY